MSNKKEESKSDQDKDEISLVQPAMATFQCIGVLRYSKTTDASQGGSWLCQGVKRHVKTTYLGGLMPVEDAIRSFQDQVDVNDSHNRRGFGGESLTHLVKKENLKLKGPTPPLEKLVMDPKFNEMQDILDQHRNISGVGKNFNDTKENENDDSTGMLDHERTGSKTVQESDANLYGVTNVNFFVLGQAHSTSKNGIKDEFQQHSISSSKSATKRYAIIPMNTFGVSKRTLKYIEHEDKNSRHIRNGKWGRSKDGLNQNSDTSAHNGNGNGNGNGNRRELIVSATTTRLGILEIDMQGFEEILHEDDHDEPNIDAGNTHPHQNGEYDNEQNASSIERRNTLLSSSSTLPKRTPTSSTSSIIPSMKEAHEFLDKYSQSSAKIKAHMHANVNFLQKELQNDFVNRTLKSSEKIVISCERNWDRMRKIIENGYKFWQDSRRN